MTESKVVSTEQDFIESEVNEEEETCTRDIEGDEEAVSRGASSWVPVDERILRAKLAVENAEENPDISSPLEVFGYDEDKFNEGNVLIDTAVVLIDLQKLNYAERTAKSDDFQNLRDELDEYYRTYFDIAKALFINDEGLADKLDLKGTREKTIAGFFGQVRRFFTNASTDEVLELLAPHNIELQVFDDGLELLDRVEDAYKAFKIADGIAQNTTVERDAALDEMEEWVKVLLTFARTALKDDIQLLETLGIVVKNPTTKSKDRQKNPLFETPPSGETEPDGNNPPSQGNAPAPSTESVTEPKPVTKKKKVEK